MTPAQAKREVQAAEWAVREAETHIEDLRRPEEKYETALMDYRERLQERVDRTIAAQMELDELQARLTKPWWRYANSKNGVRRRKQHPIANKCAELSSYLKPSWSVDYAKGELERRKDMLENFSGYMDQAERDLYAARENLRNVRELSVKIQAREAKKKTRPKKEIPDIRVTDVRSPRTNEPDFMLNADDFKAAYKAGARGISVIAGDAWYSISRGKLRDVMDTLDSFTVRVNGSFEIRWDTGYLKFQPTGPMAKWYDPLIDLNRGRRIRYDADDNPIWEEA